MTDITANTLVIVREDAPKGAAPTADRLAPLSECFPDPPELQFAAQELARLGQIRIGGGAAPLCSIIVPALCQDCLRVLACTDLTPDANDPPGLCPHCEGQTCNCHSCLASLPALMRGNFYAAGLINPVRIESWTPAGGAVVMS
jgi:hypothetical protein